MRKYLTILMTCLTLNSQADDALKVATIDMQELFKEYHRTNAAQKQINVERAKVQKENNERLARIRELDAELQNMRKQLDDPSISSSRKQTVYREWQMKQNEGVALNRERSEFMQRRNRAMNEQMVQRMKGIGRGAPPGRPLIGRWAWAVA